MRRFASLVAFIVAMPCAPAAAQGVWHEVEVIEWVEAEVTGSRFVVSPIADIEQASIASYGPFRVLDDGTAALTGITNGATPAAFVQMMAQHPGIATLRFVDCPGTHDDVANLRLGRMIRAAGLAVEVPAGGSVRSGAVDLMLSGASLTISDRAEFAVHGWIDEDGLGAEDYAPGAPEHGKYLAYYREMGLEAGAATRFYAMTNSVPYEDARWLTGAEMRDWIGGGRVAAADAGDAAPKLAYLDLGAALN